MANPRMVAKSMMRVAERQGVRLTNLTLHKLIYLAHGLMLAKFGRPLIDEKFQAWKYGPVAEPLYHDLKIFGSSPVTANSVFVSTWRELPATSQDELNVIDSVLNQFGNWSAGELIDLTHRKDGPWFAVYKSNNHNIAIDDDQIKSYFTKHLKQR